MLWNFTFLGVVISIYHFRQLPLPAVDKLSTSVHSVLERWRCWPAGSHSCVRDTHEPEPTILPPVKYCNHVLFITHLQAILPGFLHCTPFYIHFLAVREMLFDKRSGTKWQILLIRPGTNQLTWSLVIGMLQSLQDVLLCDKLHRSVCPSEWPLTFQ